jgi:two-component system response regulator AdeR
VTSDEAPDRASILLVEDDIKTAETVALYLRHGGHRVVVERDGEGGLERATTEPFDLVVLDRMLPRLDGGEVLKRMRRVTDVPVILLTAMAGERDRLDGFRAGADDYVTKPFSPRELVARVDAMLRRTGVAGRRGRVVQIGALRLDPDAHWARIGSELLDLSPTEFRLLRCLAEAHHRTFSRSELVDRALSGDPDDRVVDSHVKNLRRKLTSVGADPGWIRTVFGRGYQLSIPTTPERDP